MTRDKQLAEKEALRESAASHMRLSAIAPLTDRSLADRISGKRAIFALCDGHFDDGSRLLKEMAEHGFVPQGMEIVKWSDLLQQLPFLKADILVVSSLPPSELLRDPHSLASSLRHFRERNPSSSVVMLNLYGSATPAGSVFALLENERVVDRVQPGPVSYEVLISHGADLHELKTL